MTEAVTPWIRGQMPRLPQNTLTDLRVGSPQNPGRFGWQQEFIMPQCPQWNGMVERVIRTLKEQSVHRRRFETRQHASRIRGDWIRFSPISALSPGAGHVNTRQGP